MSHDHHHHQNKHHTKKLHKLAQLLKNRHTRDINQQAEVHARGRELEKEREEELKSSALASSRGSAAKKKAANPDTYRKLDEMRRTNSHRTKVVQDRWNRFAGTEAGGGRGL